MGVTSLREITIGVRDLDARIALLQNGCGLTVLRSGALSPLTASRLFDMHIPPKAALMGRPDVRDSPRVRLVEVGAGSLPRPRAFNDPGPLGTGFTTAGIAGVHSRLEGLGITFLSPPRPLPPMGATGTPRAPERYEAFGRTPDGDFIVLVERLNADIPYGTFGPDCSEPLHATFVVTNLEACGHFMRDVLEHEVLVDENCSSPLFDAVFGLGPGVSFRFALAHQPPDHTTGRLVFMEFQSKPEPMAQIPSLSPGICRLRYDTADLHSTLSRVPGGGGSLVRGPASLDDPVLGPGLVAMVRSPFGVLIELWQTA
jgi:catechol 2,3-dioxygenase-like lactoylglutathione lyase family enzyme